MIIRDMGEVKSIEGIERIIVLKHDHEGNIYASIRHRIRNPVPIPENRRDWFTGALIIKDLEISPRGAFGCRKSPDICLLWRNILAGELEYKEGDWEFQLASHATFIVSACHWARRYTPDAQLKELEAAFDMIWEEDNLWCIQFPKKAPLSTKIVVIASSQVMEDEMRKALNAPSDLWEKREVVRKVQMGEICLFFEIGEDLIFRGFKPLPKMVRTKLLWKRMRIKKLPEPPPYSVEFMEECDGIKYVWWRHQYLLYATKSGKWYVGEVVE